MIAALHLRGKWRTFAGATFVALLMVGVGFASVPLYRMFCQATGWNGTVQEKLNATAPGEVVGKLVDVRFDANVKPGMDWSFEPDDRVKRVAIGARQMAFFTAVNNTDRTITGSASFNVTPANAGPFFVKIQCFCFTEQTLRPHERVRMPVIFYVDPSILADADAAKIGEITLSYTFFPVASPETAS